MRGWWGGSGVPVPALAFACCLLVQVTERRVGEGTAGPEGPTKEVAAHAGGYENAGYMRRERKATSCEEILYFGEAAAG